MTIPWITRRDALAAVGAFAAWPALAQSLTARPQVQIATDKGVIIVELELEKAPLTAANFLRYVDTGRFDGSSFYRASRSPFSPATGLIEGGLQNDPKRLLPPVAHESTLATGLSHRDGTISMAREAQGTATADFFICVGAASYLDAKPGAKDSDAGYAAFGQVIAGMDIVRAILALPTPGAARNPVMRGQILDPPVKIVSMRRSA